MIKAHHILYCKHRKNARLFLIICVTVLLSSCAKHENKNAIFEVLGDDRTGLHFVNSLKATREFNMFDYMYFYNGQALAPEISTMMV